MPQPRSSTVSLGSISWPILAASLRPAASNSSGLRLFRIWSIASDSSWGTQRVPYTGRGGGAPSGASSARPERRSIDQRLTSVRAAAREDRRDRLGEDRDVQPDRPVL